MARKPLRIWLVALALAAVLAACAPASAPPTATPASAPTVAPTITPDAAQPLVLVLPAVYDQKTLIAANRHYSDAVKRKGWNVEFYTVQSSDAYGAESYLPYVSKQLSSGAARADGFVCMQVLSPDGDQTLQAAKANGLLYDCAAAAPQAVPQYWAKFHDQISAGKYGLTLGTQSDSSIRIDESVLLVRDDILPLAGQGMSGYDDLHALLSRLQQDDTSKEYVQADSQQMLRLWIKRQGYMALFADAGIYARMDDPEAKAVLLEDIPGFEQFAQERVDQQAKGLVQPGAAIISSDGSLFVYGQNANGGSTGPAEALVYAYNLIYYDYERGRWKGYTAFLPADDSPYADNWYDAAIAGSTGQVDVLRALIIPARSRRAADAMAFIQWIYADRRNADVVIYGQEGEDYALQKERVELMGGNALQSSQGVPSWQNWPGSYLFQRAAERRIDADAPKNTEALLSARAIKPLAAPWLANMGNTEAWGGLMSRGSMDSRQNAIQTLMDMMQSLPGSAVDIAPYLELLRAGATDSVLQPYLDVLAEARAGAAQH